MLYLICHNITIASFDFISCMSFWFLEISHTTCYMNTIIVSDVNGKKVWTYYFSSQLRFSFFFRQRRLVVCKKSIYAHATGLIATRSSKLLVFKNSEHVKKEIVILIILNTVNRLNFFFKLLVLVTSIFNIQKWYQSTGNHLI